MRINSVKQQADINVSRKTHTDGVSNKKPTSQNWLTVEHSSFSLEDINMFTKVTNRVDFYFYLAAVKADTGVGKVGSWLSS